MRIAAVSVKGLFGLFNHSIPMNLEERITIIHGPNGYGKTVILQMMDGFCNGDYGIFFRIPFREFVLRLDDGKRVALRRTEQKGQGKILVQLEPSGERAVFDEPHKREESDFPISAIESLVPSLERVSPREWLDRNSNEVLSLDQVFRRYGDALPFPKPRDQAPSWLRDIQLSINTHYVQTNRLIIPQVSGRRSRSYEPGQSISSTTSTVSKYSAELSQKMKDVILAAAERSQTLERTFPKRLVAQLRAKKQLQLSADELRQQLRSLEERRKRLVAVGLMEDSDSDVQIGSGPVEEMITNVLAAYARDTEQKLKVYDDLQAKISLLLDILNVRYDYSYKKLGVDKARGFVVKTHTSESLSPNALSSGEQHELVLFYELLFRVAPGSLILIDEPELSLHIAWQQEFLKDLFAIIELSNIDVLIATHSADIIYDRWALAVELKGPEE